MKFYGWMALSFLAVVGCGGPPQGIVQFTGVTPQTALEKDQRGLVSHCSECSGELEFGAEKCPNVARKKCSAKKLKWADGFACSFCGGTGICKACFMLNQLVTDETGDPKGSVCFNCKGDGYIVFEGKTRDCASCKPRGKCPSCSGTAAHTPECKQKGKCQTCGGSGRCDMCGGPSGDRAKPSMVSRDKAAELAQRSTEPVAEEKKAEEAKP